MSSSMGLRARLGAMADRSGLPWFRRLLGLAQDAEPLFTLPRLIEKPSGTRVLALAPHADDEALGCGGALHKHHLAGDRVTVAYMTDGSRGYEMAGGVEGAALIDLREREARAAAAVLGVNDCVFLRNPDTGLVVTAATVAQLVRILAELRPEVLYLPSPMETHRDHRQTCLIAAQALAGYPEPVKVYLYEIWAPVPANCAIAIDLDRKLAAVRCYRSQMDERELYVKTAVSLAHYRGITCLPGQDTPVECFLQLDRAAFVTLASAGA